MPLLTPDRSEIERCWNLLPHPEGTVVRVFARNRDTGALDGDFARNAAEMFHFASVNVDKQVYVCPNPCRRTTGTRHNAQDVTHWSYLLIDMDPIEDIYDPALAVEQALFWLGRWTGMDFEKTKPLIIDSGRGRQVWLRLDDHPLQPDGQVKDDAVMQDDGSLKFYRAWDRRTCRKVNGYWLGRLATQLGMIHGCKVDTSTSDLPRPMRMPGTYNQKTQRMATIVEPSYHIFGPLGDRLMVSTPDDVKVEPDVIPIAPGLPWQMATHRLTLTAKKYLKEGQEEPGRHKVMWHTARKLHELGVSRAEARKALTHANKLCGEDQALGAEEIEHALDTAEGK